MREQLGIETLNVKYTICGKCHCPFTVFRQNQNLTNGLDARAQTLDQIQLRKTTTIIDTNHL